jgi:hypothetical protein
MYAKYNNYNFIPSSLVLNLNLSRHFENKTLSERNRISVVNYKLHEICSVKHNFFKNTKTKLCPIYYTDTLTLAVTQNILDAKYLNEDKDEIMNMILNKYHNYINYLLHLKN